jgi:hypothetical protein
LNKNPYRAWVLPLVAVVALAVTLAARAETLPLQDQVALDAAATWMANSPITVRCMASDEPKSPASMDAWGYSFLFAPVIYLDSQVCDGALAIVHHDTTVPLWEEALGALVLTHESFHQRLDLKNRGNEAATECRAIRHTAYMIRHLGGSEGLEQELMPLALAMHFRIGAINEPYNDPYCKVPWYWE